MAVLTAALAAGVGMGLPADASAQESITTQQKAAAKRVNSPFNLNAGPSAVLQGNLVQCGIDSQGNICTDIFNSPTGGGGFWPSGTTNQYMFNSGLQIAAINGDQAGPWANDTVGAYFFDARGTQPHGTPLTNVFNSLDPDDLANWPQEAYITDTDIFNAALVGQKTASAQDSWVQYWDGDPNRISQRAHPMGVKVTQRSLAFNAPVGAEHSVFFIINFENVTNDPAFQIPNEAKFGVQLPDAGWTFTNVYAAFGADPDVTTHAGNNFSTAILPVNMAVAYHSEFQTDDFNYNARASLYSPPFMQAPGLVGVSYLKSPIDPATGREIGLTMFTNTTNGGSFPDMVGVKQLFRYLKGDTQPAAGDNSCNQPNSIQNRVCYLAQEPADTRFYMVSGPFSIEPGQQATIVVGMSHAAALSIPGYTPGQTLRPGIPSRYPGLFGNAIRGIEQMAGLTAMPPSAVVIEDGDTVIVRSEIEIVRNSLLFNAEVGRGIFANMFLLPSAPQAPPFTLVPGDQQVTVLWQPTLTEETGDPYITVARDTDSPFYDPNFREFDVEGYRIYRAAGLQGDFELLAQFDKTGTTFTDATGQLDSEFVPEEGAYGDEVEYDLSGTIIQYPTGSRIRDATSGAVIVLEADTIQLSNTGVPFVFVDNDVTNGITYRYIVTAFDVNSLQSGSASLESPRAPQFAVPRSTGANIAAAQYSFEVAGDEVLDMEQDLPTIDAEGRFSGPQPPSNAFAGNFVPAVAQALTPGSYGFRMDSVQPAYYAATYFLSDLGTGQVYQFDVDRPDQMVTLELNPATVPADPSKVAGLFATTPTNAGAVFGEFRTNLWHFMSGEIDWTPLVPAFWGVDPNANAVDGGSRWFTGENETTADPTLDDKQGHIDGYTIFKPVPYVNVANSLLRRWYQTAWSTMRAADFEITWSGGSITSVRDLTHKVDVRFSPNMRSSWGFIPDADGNGVLDYYDLRHTTGAAIPQFTANPKVPFTQTPNVMPTDTDGDQVADGTGFGLYINGEPFFFNPGPPSDGVWTLRTHTGEVIKTASGYNWTPSFRNGAVPGLKLQVVVTAPAQVVANVTEGDLADVHTVPDPYYVRSAFDIGPSNKTLRFVNLPNQALVRIFSVSGTLVRTLEHNDPVGGGEVTWDLRNRNNQFVASGVYFYVVEAPNGTTKTGRLTVIQFAR